MKLNFVFLLALVLLFGADCQLSQADVELRESSHSARAASRADKDNIRAVEAQKKTLQGERNADLAMASAAQKTEMEASMKASDEEARAKEARADAATLGREADITEARIAALESTRAEDARFLDELYKKRSADTRELMEVAEDNGRTEAALQRTPRGDAREQQRLTAAITAFKATLASLRETIKADRERELTQERKIKDADVKLSEARVRLQGLRMQIGTDKVKARGLTQEAEANKIVSIRSEARSRAEINSARALKAPLSDLDAQEGNLEVDASAREAQAEKFKKEAERIADKERQIKVDEVTAREKMKAERAKEIQREKDLDKKIAEFSL